MKKIVLLMAMIALAGAPVSAQSFLERMKERAKNAAENNIGNKVEKGVNDILNGEVGKKDKNKDKKEEAAPAATAPATEAAREISKIAGPETPVSVNCSSPALSARMFSPAQRRRAQSARTPLRARG